MKAIFYKSLLCILLLCSTHSWAQQKVSKSIQKTFPLTNTGELHIENKYGNVIINGWNEKNIQINVEIQVTKKNKEDAKELLNRIHSRINNTDDFVKIKL